MIARNLQKLAIIIGLSLLSPATAKQTSEPLAVGAKGKQEQFVMTFPTSGPIGELGIVGDGADYAQKHIEAKMAAKARGRVAMTRGVHLYFNYTDYMGLEKPFDVISAIPPEALTGLSLCNTIFPENDLSKLLRFTQLRRLELSSTEVSDESLMKLAKLPHLEAIAVDRTRIRGRFLVDFANNKNLTFLSINHNEIDRKYLQELKNFPKLSYMDISCSHINDADLPKIAACPSLTFLDLSENAAITNKGLVQLKPLIKLNKLQVTDSNVTAAGILTLKGLPIKTLRIEHKQASDKDIVALKKTFPGLRINFEDLKEQGFSIYKEVFQ
jgi:hypothetical protein